MPTKIKCVNCRGNGRFVGGYMPTTVCDVCHGSGKIIDPNAPDDDELFSKTSKEYRKAKIKIKEKFKDISDEEAEQYLDSALNEKQDA